MIQFEKIVQQAQRYEPEMTRFLRDMVAIRSYDGAEGEVILRIKQEMEKVGFDRIDIDPMGNILGYIGHGSHLIAMDAHIDTVTYGDLANWKFDPFQGMEDAEVIGGLGSSDQKGGMAAMVYAGKIIKDLKLEDDYTLLVVGSVQEEDCDGLCWQYIIEQDKIRPDFAVLSEPSNGHIKIGQRGRMEIKVTTYGISCHGSTPERGVNAVYKMAPVIKAIERLNGELVTDGVLGKGSVTISEIYSTSPSRCAVAGSCSISLDRRLNSQEPAELAMEQIRNLPEVMAAEAEISLYSYEEPSYTGLVYATEKYYSSWVIKDSEPIRANVINAYRNLFNTEPTVELWIGSNNGVAIMGKHQIPCIGFGPGHEEEAHVPNEKTWKKELVMAAAMYATIPQMYVSR